jgi:hypothetical protein
MKQLISLLKQQLLLFVMILGLINFLLVLLMLLLGIRESLDPEKLCILGSVFY